MKVPAISQGYCDINVTRLLFHDNGVVLFIVKDELIC